MNPASFNFFVSLIEDITGDIHFSKTKQASEILEDVVEAYVKYCEQELN